MIARHRRFLTMPLFAAAGLFWVGATAACGQTTDACIDAPLVILPTFFIGNFATATPDGASSCSQCSPRDVWVKFIAPFDQDVIASTCGGSPFDDTLLSLHTGCPGNVENELACNDDACMPNASIRVTVHAGQMYYLRIAGRCDTSVGHYSVTLDYELTPLPPRDGPDLVTGAITDSRRLAAEGSFTAYSFGSTACNIGTEDAMWVGSTSEHPLIHQAIYRVKSGRIEQLSQSWLKHGFATLDDGLCGPCTGPTGQLLQYLSPGCSDTYQAIQSGVQGSLGPKWEVNATTGVFPYPSANPPWSGVLDRRMQVLTSEIDPAQNTGAQYFAEVQYIAADDSQAGNGLNNASHRRFTLSSVTSTPFLIRGTIQQQPAIHAWRAADQGVTIVNSDYTEQGLTARFIVAAKATDLGNGTWDYEYAVRNMNSHRSARAFAVRMPSNQPPTNVGFRDVAYHSGDGEGDVDVSGTDWQTLAANGWYSWETQTYAQNSNANALRWGTMYNFRFRSPLPPTTGDARLTLFRPGASGEPDELLVPGLPVPGVPECAADFDGNGSVQVPDIFAFLAAWFAEDTAADFDGIGGIAVPDIFAFLAAWFAGC
jgi:hypothetical protein